MFKNLLMLIPVFLIQVEIQSQITLPGQEHFSFGTGDLALQDNNWVRLVVPETTSVDMQIVSGNLSYAGYPISVSGNQLKLESGLFGGGQGNIDYIRFPQINSGSTIYVSFLLKINNLNDLTTDGGFFAGFGNSSSTVEEGYGRIWIRKPNSSAINTFNLGVTKNSNAGVYRDWTPLDYNVGTTYLIVASYSVVEGLKNDLVKVWVNPDLSGPEPAPTIQIGVGSPFDDGTPIETFFFRQTSEIVNANVDEMRLSTDWAQAPLPVELVSFTATVIGEEVKLIWRTATEVNNYGFEIERKSGIPGTYETGYEKIGFVNGNGNSNSTKDYSFMDDGIKAGKYTYRLKQIDNDGKIEYSNAVEIDINSVNEFRLAQNYPNPFNPVTRISWQSPVHGWQTLKVYDVLGKEVATLVNGEMDAGNHEVSFNGTDLPSGMYIYKLQSGTNLQTKKMMLMK